MKLNSVLTTILKLMEARDLTENKLSKISTVSQSTLNSLFNKNNTPTIPTLELLCEGFGITMSEFFAIMENNLNIEEQGVVGYTTSLSEESINDKAFIDAYLHLPEEKKNLLVLLVESWK